MDDRLERLNLSDVEPDEDVEALVNHLFAVAMQLQDPTDHYAVTAAMHVIRRVSIVGELPQGVKVADVMQWCLVHAVRMNRMVQDRVEDHFIEQDASTHLHAQGWTANPSFTLPFPVETADQESPDDKSPPEAN